jgi:hypothetical protein
MPRLLLMAALFLGSVGPASAVAPRSRDGGLPAAYLPGGLADPAGKTGYVTNPSGGIDALDLETGRLLWSTRVSGKLLGLEGRHLILQTTVKGRASDLIFPVLDVLDGGKVLRQCGPVELPTWVAAGPSTRPALTIEVKIENGSLLVSWQARGRFTGGRRMRGGFRRMPRRAATGTVRIDLESGRVTAQETRQRLARPTAELTGPLGGLTSLPYWTETGWESKPLQLGRRVAVLVADRPRGQAATTLRLRTWDRTTARLLTDVVLFQARAPWPQVAPDRRYLFLHQAVPREELPEGDDAWWVFSLETGKQVAKVPYEVGTGLINLIGPRVYYLVDASGKGQREKTPGRLLKALDVKSGKLLWQHPVAASTAGP